MKICNKCKLEKPLFEFHKRKNSVDGHQAKCKKCFQEMNLAWYQKNKEKRLVSSKVWYKKNKERKKQTQQIWIEKNKEFYLQSQASRRHIRRAREINAEGMFSRNDVKNLYQLQKGKCAGCGVKLVKYHVDHIMPLALGGSNWPDNLQILCVNCNLSKHAKHPIDWANENGKLL